VSIIAGEDKEDYHTVGLDNVARLDPTWRKFVFVFTATRTVRNSHRLTFLMGDNPGDVDLAGVELRPGAEALVDPSGGVETDLSAADFKFSPTVTVPVKYRGKPVQDLAVTLKSGDETIGSKKLGAADRGAGRFSDVPIDEKITVVVSDGRQTAEFPRIVASDAPDVVADVEVPDSWTDVQTLADAAGTPLPFVGAWESRTGPGASRYITTFNADGTGTIKRVTEDPLSGAALKTFASGAFLWHLKDGDRTIVMSSKEYTWSVVGKGRDAKLVLKDAKGKNHTLVRR
jgi:hypothetical protein